MHLCCPSRLTFVFCIEEYAVHGGDAIKTVGRLISIWRSISCLTACFVKFQPSQAQ